MTDTPSPDVTAAANALSSTLGITATAKVGDDGTSYIGVDEASQQYLDSIAPLSEEDTCTILRKIVAARKPG